MKLQLDDYDIEYELTVGTGTCIGPCVIFCPGFNSTMHGNKARALKSFCVENGWAF